MPNGMQFNVPMPRPVAPVGMRPPPQINYQKQLAGLSPFNAMQSLIGSGYQPMDVAAAYQQYQQTGQGPQPTWDRFTWAGGGGRYAPPQQPGMPQQQQAPVPPPMGGGSTGFMAGAPGTPFARTPFYLEPGRDNAGATMGSGIPPRIMPPRVGVPQIPPEMAGTQLGGGFAGAAPNVMQQAQQAGMGGMTAGATPAGQGMREWEVGRPGQSREEAGYNFLMAQGMPDAQARQRSGWTGAAGMTAAASQSRQQVQNWRPPAPGSAWTAMMAREGGALTADQARMRGIDQIPPSPAVSSVSHSGGALLPQLGGGVGQAGSGQYAPQSAAPRPGYTPAGQSINTYGTPMTRPTGQRAQLGSSGYRY